MAKLPYKHATDLNIPEATSGDLSIKHRIIKKNSKLVMQYGVEPVTLPFDLFVNVLEEHKPDTKPQVWMSDTPMEIQTHKKVIKAAKGRVLIGGLGLGYVAREIAKKDEVLEVNIVEISPDVKKLVWPHIKMSKMNFIHDDLFNYLGFVGGALTEVFDFAYFDIWPDHDAMHLRDFITPLRKLAKPLMTPKGKIMCWVEDEIRLDFGHQLIDMFVANVHLVRVPHKLRDNTFLSPFARFILKHRHEMSQIELANYAMRYAKIWGTEKFEKEFGQYVTQ